MNRRFYEYSLLTVVPTLEDLGIDSSDSGKALIDINSVCAIYESNKNGTDITGTKIELDNGESFMVLEDYELVKKQLLDAHS